MYATAHIQICCGKKGNPNRGVLFGHANTFQPLRLLEMRAKNGRDGKGKSENYEQKVVSDSDLLQIELCRQDAYCLVPLTTRHLKTKRHSSTKTAEIPRYSAKLLFQFRVMVDGSAGVRRICEERIVTFSAKHGKAALREGKRRGRLAEHRYENNDGNPVHFEFVGVLEVLRLDPACEADEVWYEITERVRPMERKASIIPPESQLSEIRNRD